MSHPFELKLSDLKAIDLEFEESLPPEAAEHVGGGTLYTTLALGEEGGYDWYPIDKRPPYWGFPLPYPPKHPPFPIERPRPYPRPPIQPPEVTTLALGEEGGEWFI